MPKYETEICPLCNKPILKATELYFEGEEYAPEIDQKNLHYNCFFEWEESPKYLHDKYYMTLNQINADDITDIIHYNDEFTIYSKDGLHIQILLKKPMLSFTFHIENWQDELLKVVEEHDFNKFPTAVRFNALKNLALIGERYEEVEVMLSTVYSLYIIESFEKSKMTEAELLKMIMTLLEKAVNSDYSLGIIVMHALEIVIPNEHEDLAELIKNFKQVNTHLTNQLYEFLTTEEAKNSFLEQLNNLLLPGTPRFLDIIENTVATVEYLWNKRVEEQNAKLN